MFLILGSFAAFIFYWYDQTFSEYSYWVIDYNDEHALIGRITDLGDAGNYIVLLLFLWLWFVVIMPKIPAMQSRWKKSNEIKNVVIHAMISLTAAGLVTELLKILVGRERPHCSKYFNPYCFKPLSFDPHFHSFPSGHSEFIFCLMTVLSFKWRRLREIFFFVAVMVSFSRVFLGQHFLSDVVIGAFVGCFTASCVHYLFRDSWPLHSPDSPAYEISWVR